MKNTRKLLKKELFCLVYVIAIILCLFKVGKINKITTYNISGVSSILSTNLEKEYIPPVIEQIIITEPEKHNYRLTSFYKDYCTGSGLCKNNFQLNDKGWYTYNGKLVVATATPYMINVFGKKENKLYFKYWDEIRMTIDGVDYDAIVLDTCGACYRDERVDLMVQDAAHVIDRGYRGKNMIQVEVTRKQ